MKAKCNNKCSILGNMNYLGAIDRMANAVTPKNYLPISNVKYGAILDMPKERVYKKFMHFGPAQTSSLNKKQTSHLVHELRERGYSSTAAKEAAHEGRELSRKYMNSPWAKVPTEYRRKYGGIDFDGDGIPNSMDCFPFDYDRQAEMSSTKSSSKNSSGLISYMNPSTVSSGSTQKSTTTTKTTTTSNAKPSTVQYVTDGLGRTVKNDAYVAPKATSSSGSSSSSSSSKSSGSSGSSSSSSSSKSSGSSGSSSSSSSSKSSGSSGSQGLIQYITPEIVSAPNTYFTTGSGSTPSPSSSSSSESSSGKTSATPAVTIPAPISTTKLVLQPTSSTALFSPSTGQYGPYVDAQLIPNTGVYDVTTQTYTDPQGNKTSRSQKDVPSGATIMAGVGTEQATRVVQPGDYYLAEVPETPAKTTTKIEESPIYSDMTDQEKYQQIYNDILNKKITDPNEIKRLMQKIAPYQRQYDFDIRSLKSRNLFEQKKRGLLTGGDTDFLNQKVFQRRQDLLEQRAAAKLEFSNKRIEDVTKSFNKEIEAQVEKETEARKGEYVKPVITGYNVKTTTSTTPASTALKLAVLKA